MKHSFRRAARSGIHLISFLILFLIQIQGNAQTVYQPVTSDIYQYLERLSIKGIIDYHNEVKPIARTEIAKFLLEAEEKDSRLTRLEKEQLEFYIKDYADEIDFINSRMHYNLPASDFFSSRRTGRFRLYDYRDSSFSIYVDPVLGIEAGKVSGSSLTHRWNGAALYGYYKKNWGFSLNAYDNEEIGDNIDITRSLTPKPGIVLTKTGKNSIQYDEVNAQFNYSWSSGVVSIGKYYLNWGSGRSGQLIFSDKAPSFPLIRFDFSPVHWLRFTYFHGLLNSEILDSSTIRYTNVQGRPSFLAIPKFIAAHMLSVDIKENLTLSVGESIVYSDRFQPAFLIPVLFFKIADHYLSVDNGSTTGNSQIFADLYYKNSSLKTKFYSTLFIDELSLESIFKGGNLSAIAYTLGFETVDPVINNSSFVLEYTRINPFVYMNSNNAQLYTNRYYQLGHWIGSNGDQVYISYEHRFMRGLYAKVSADYIRKGQKELPEQQYELPYPSFLYGAKKKVKDITFEVGCEPLHTLFLKANYQFSDISDEDPARTPAFMLGKKSSFGISISYGL